MNRILVVDDEELIRSFIKKFLSSHNYLIDTAENFDEALTCLRSNKYDCVIVDIVLPEKDGIDLIEQARKSGFNQPVILITGQPNVETAKQAIKFNAYDYLTKPISNAELLAVVKNAIKQNQIQIREEQLKNQQQKSKELLETEVQKRIAELNESETKYRNLIEQSLAGVYVIQDNIYKYVNSRFLQLVNYQANELINKKSIYDLVTVDGKKVIKENLAKLISEEIQYAQYDFKLIKKNGDYINVEVWEGKIIYEGQPAIQGIMLDISEIIELSEREKEFELKLMHEHKLAAIGQLATGIAHNLNTPISVILGNAELLQLKNEDSPELGKIIRQAERMNTIIHGLLTKSSKEQSRKPQTFDLNLMIASELEIFNANLDFKHNVKKNFTFGDNIPDFYAVYSDFSQSIMNIIQNAMDAMYNSSNKQLTIDTSFKNDFIYVRIGDSGCGISEKEYTKLFDPFYTTKPAIEERKKDEPTGTGLGLSSVHNLLSQYGVEINFDSEINKGTTVELKIPYQNISPKTNV